MLMALIILGLAIGWIATTIINDLMTQIEANDFRQTAGLHKKAVRIRRII